LPAPQYQPPMPQPRPPSGNDRAVREMLINLLREKRFKKLDEIQKYMASQGLVTSVQVLKRYIDDIRAKNAQRKQQQEQQQQQQSQIPMS